MAPGASRDPESERERLERHGRMLVAKMRSSGANIGAAGGEVAVQAAEAALRVPFPFDYRAYLLEAGGACRGTPWRGLFALSELVSLNRNLPVFRWFGGLIGIANEGFTVHALDYRRGMPPYVVSFGLSSSDWADVTLEAATFEEWVRDSL